MDNFYKPKILNFYVDWKAIKDACMVTVGKEAGKEPNTEWKRKLLLCQHSPIRRSLISIKWDNIPYAISTHFARHHEGMEKFIKTSRTDRTGVDRNERSQMEMVSMEMDLNIQALINIISKRVCFCADPTTRKYAWGLLEAIKEYDENVYWACVPQCIRHGGCTEMFGDCNFFANFAKSLTKEQLIDLRQRYDAYNEFRERKVIKK